MKLIPTNIITGFLGVGKTTLIRHLLQQKPKGERWAVLVNEFGEVGIDGALLREGGATVKEIPGGCMCCVAGLPMQVGLTKLLRSQQFDRLIIEPTGLGHPVEVLQTLQTHFADYLEIKASLTLTDPRHFSSERHTSNEIFRQQLNIADVLVCTKLDLANDENLHAMNTTLNAWQLSERPRTNATQGALAQYWLDLPYSHGQQAAANEPHHGHNQYPANALASPSAEQPVVSKQHSGQGYYSCGWAIHPSHVFAMEPLFLWVSGLSCERLKAVVITDRGIIALNLADGVLKMQQLDECEDSRLEIIHKEVLGWDILGEELIKCLA